MPRVGRVVLPNYPHHIVQRGHNRQVVFAANRDYEYYLETLSEYRDVYAKKGTLPNVIKLSPKSLNYFALLERGQDAFLTILVRTTGSDSIGIVIISIMH